MGAMSWIQAGNVGGTGNRAALLAGTGLAGLLAAGLSIAPRAANAQLPTGGQVVGGSATITRTNPNQLTITQSTDRTAINWNTFNIGAGNGVHFQQPSAGSIALNRVTSADPSVIGGRLTANGRVVLINPNGTVFTQGSQVNVGSLVATTADIPTTDFMNGSLSFNRPGRPGASVVNEGEITVAEGGLAALVAPEVRNSGTIRAQLGRVTLAGAETFALDPRGDGLISFEVAGLGPARTTRAENTGTITADGGQVQISAAAAKGVVEGVVNVGGVVAARSVGTQNGVVVFGGGEGTTTTVSGTVDVSGAGAGQTGGRATVTGERVRVTRTARVDASGAAGGGTVLVGGDVQGRGPTHTARRTTVEAGATIRADATVAGNGGTAVVWSNEFTQFMGAISARGGAAGGNGGFAEVSGKLALDFRGTVDLRAPQGTTGTLLLDPTSISIVGALTAAPDAVLAGGEFAAPDAAAGAPVAPATSEILNTTLATALNAASVVVTTASDGVGAGTISVDAPVTWTSANTLTLRADAGITVGAALTATAGNGSLTLLGNQTVAGGSGIAINAAINLGTGALSMTTPTGNISSNVAGTIGAGTITGTATAGNIALGASVTGTGALALTAGNGISTTAVAALAGDSISLTANGAGGISLLGNATAALTPGVANMILTTTNVAGADISQGAASVLTARNLVAVSTGAVSLGNTSNLIGDPLAAGFAGGAIGTAGAGGFTLASSRNFAIGAIPGGPATLVSGGLVSLRAPSLRIAAATTAAAGSAFTLRSGTAGSIDVQAGLFANGGTALFVADTITVGATGGFDPSARPGTSQFQTATAGRAIAVGDGAAGAGLNLTNGADSTIDRLGPAASGTLRVGATGLTAGETASGVVTVTGLADAGGRAIGSLLLESAAAGAGAVTQTGALTTTALGVRTAEATSSVALANVGNSIGTLAAEAGSGGINVQSAGGFQVGTAAAGFAGINTTGALALGATTGNITQASGAANRVAAGATTLNATAGSVVLGNVANAITSATGTAGAAGGSFGVVDSNALSVGAVTTGANGRIDLRAGASSALTLTGALNSGAGTLVFVADTLTLAGGTVAGGAPSRVEFRTATADRAIAAGTGAAGGGLVLGNGTLTTFAPATDGTLRIGSEGTVVGEARSGAVSLSSLSIAGRLIVESGAGGNAISQTGGSVITARQLTAQALNGSVVLDGNNQVQITFNPGRVGGTSGGDFTFTNVGSFNTENITAAGQIVTLTSNTGEIGQVGGSAIVANELVARTLNVDGAVTLDQAGNDVRRVGGSMSLPAILGGNGFVYVGQGAVEVADIAAPFRLVEITSTDSTVNVGGLVRGSSLLLDGATGVTQSVDIGPTAVFDSARDVTARSATGAVVLDRASNGFTAISGEAATGFTATTSGNLALGAVGYGTQLLAQSGGTLTVTGALTPGAAGTTAVFIADNITVNAGAGFTGTRPGRTEFRTFTAGRTITAGTFAGAGLNLGSAAGGALDLLGPEAGGTLRLGSITDTSAIAITGLSDPGGRGIGTLLLESGAAGSTAISQTGGLTTTELALRTGATGGATLQNSGNSIGTVAASGGSGGVAVSGAGNMAVGTVDGIAGVTASNGGRAAVQAGGNLAVNQAIDTTGAVTIGAGQGLTTTATVSGGSVQASANGAGGVDVQNTITALPGGDVVLQAFGAGQGVTIGATVQAGNLMSAQSSSGAVTTNAAISGAAVTLSGASVALGQDVTATGLATLAASAGSVTQSGGTLGAGSLLATATNAVALNTVGLAGGALAGSAGAGGFQVTTTGPASIGTAGAVSGITTTGGGAVDVTSTGALTVAQAVNAAGAVTLTGTTLSTQAAGGVSGSTVTLTGADGVTLNSAIAATTRVTLDSSAGAVGQGGGSITGTELLATAAIAVNLGTTNLANGTLAGTAGAGGFTVANTGDLAIGTVGTVSGVTTAGNGPVNITSTGAMNVTQAVDAGTGAATLAGATLATTGAGGVAGGTVSLSGTNSVTLDSAIAAATRVTLTSTAGSVTQAGGSISGTELLANAANAVGLAATTLANGTLAGSAGAGGFRVANTGDLTLGTVGGTSGVATTGDGAVNVTTTGAMLVSQAVNAGAGAATLAGGSLATQGAGTVTGGTVALAGDTALNVGADVTAATRVGLTSATGSITQTGGTVSGTSLLANAGNAVALTSIDFANGTVAGSAGAGGFALSEVGALTIGTVDATSGIVTTGGGNITVTAGTQLSVTQAVDAGTGAASLTGQSVVTTGAGSVAGDSVTLAGSNGVALGADINATGRATLDAANGSITQTAGVVTAAELLATAQNAVQLDSAGTAVGTLAGRAGAGGFRLTNTGALAVGTVGGTSGVASTGGDVALTSTGMLTLNQAVAAAGNTVRLDAGSITQTAQGGITANALLAQSNAGSVLLNGATTNAVGTVAGTATGPSTTSFAFTNSQNLVVGEVTNLAGVGVAGVTATNTAPSTGPLDSSLVDLRVADADLTVSRALAAERIQLGLLGGTGTLELAPNTLSGTGSGLQVVLIDVTNTVAANSRDVRTMPTFAGFGGSAPNTTQLGVVRVGSNTGATVELGSQNMATTSLAMVINGSTVTTDATGINVRGLAIFAPASDSTSSVTLFGTINGLSGAAAASLVGLSRDAAKLYNLNNCPVATVACVVQPQTVPAVPRLGNDLVLERALPPIDAASLSLVNIGNEDGGENEEDRRIAVGRPASAQETAP